jgi:hypothetical protein
MSIPSLSRLYRSAVKSALNHHWLRRGIFVILAIISIVSFSSHSSAATPTIHSEAGAVCIDLDNNRTAPGTAINGRSCNNSQAQAWTVRHDSITHGNSSCLAIKDDSMATNSTIIASTCSDAPGQVWLQDQKGFFNPNSGLCLSLPASDTIGALTIEPCAVSSNAKQQWVSGIVDQVQLSQECQKTSGGERISCYAEREWSRWQSDASQHQNLLAAYTANSPDEAWCADFVSYIYREAGQPFTGGEAVDWDEAEANNIQDHNFTEHDANGSYTPKPGDIAYFSYSGGHVEIVVRGGAHPTFVYGNSGTTDPLTGNGEMAANTITSDEPNGHLLYYLSKN